MQAREVGAGKVAVLRCLGYPGLALPCAPCCHSYLVVAAVAVVTGLKRSFGGLVRPLSAF